MEGKEVVYVCSQTKKDLMLLKIKLDFKSLDDTIKYLIDYYKSVVPSENSENENENGDITNE